MHIHRSAAGAATIKDLAHQATSCKSAIPVTHADTRDSLTLQACKSARWCKGCHRLWPLLWRIEVHDKDSIGFAI